jgi:Protein of unknown function (DUF3106)
MICGVGAFLLNTKRQRRRETPERKTGKSGYSGSWERIVIAGLKGLGRASSHGNGAVRVSRAFLFALALAALPNPGLAASYHYGYGSYSARQARFYPSPRSQGFYAGPGLYGRQGRPVFYAYGRQSRQASPGGAHPPGYGPARNPQARPPYEGNQGPRNLQGRPAYGGKQGPQHLGAWLQQHGNMSPAEQEKALQSEPGFDRLPPQTQQQLVNRLRQIDNMPPDQRQRTLDRIEAVEHLSPEMRQQVRASIGQMAALPPDRQRIVKKEFRNLRDYPPDQRETMMASPEFQRQFTPQERGILSGLLTVEPYEPNAGFRPEYSPAPPGK